MPARRLCIKRRLAASAVLVLVFFALVGCGSGQPAQSSDGTTTLRIATIPIDAEAQVFYAKDQGFFEEVGIDVEIQAISNGSAIAAAVASNSVDIGCSNVVSIGTAVEQGLPLSLVAPGAIYSSEAPSTALMVAQDSPIQSAQELNGKVVAVNGVKNITQVGAQAWLDENGGDGSSVQFFEMPFPQMGEALEQGTADAAIVAEPALTRAKSRARILGDAYSAIADRFLITAYFARSDWAEENPEVVEKFAEAIQKAGDWANENPEESAQVLVANTQIPAEVANRMTRAVNGETFDPALMQPPLDSARNFGILREPLDAEELVPGETRAAERNAK